MMLPSGSFARLLRQQAEFERYYRTGVWTEGVPKGLEGPLTMGSALHSRLLMIREEIDLCYKTVI